LLPGSLQTAVKIGRRTFSRQDPDANGLYVLNTILGGYFSSRLMTNIREKKGYTYNIYSSNDHHLHDGYLYISTEVNAGKGEATIRQIQQEMARLREERVTAEELQMVRSYLTGIILNGLDGVMNTADILKGFLLEGTDRDDFYRLTAAIRNIGAEEIQQLAERYLQPEDYWVVTVGPNQRQKRPMV
jgi:predicted Zn-dependent peptidase